MTTRNTVESLAIAAIVVAIAAIAITTGCTATTGETSHPFTWQHRFAADVAIVATTDDAAPTPRPQPKVGDRCRDCNDPPGACGVGRVGDGRDCDRCGSCGGDGRIDESDLAETAGNETPAARTITLRMSYGSQGWGAEWWQAERKRFVDSGWAVKAAIEVDGVVDAPHFEVVDGDDATQFHEPLTLELLEAWER